MNFVLLCEYCSGNTFSQWDNLIVAGIFSIVGIAIGGGINMLRDYLLERKKSLVRKREIHRSIAAGLSTDNNYSFYIEEARILAHFFEAAISKFGQKVWPTVTVKEFSDLIEEFRVDRLKNKHQLEMDFADYYAYFGEDEEMNKLFKGRPKINIPTQKEFAEKIDSLTVNEANILLKDTVSGLKLQISQVSESDRKVTKRILDKLPKV